MRSIQARCEAGTKTWQGHGETESAALLIEGKTLPAVYLDHPLKGGWRGYRDAHIEPDWLLIYEVTTEVVRFERTGRHTDLFGE